MSAMSLKIHSIVYVGVISPLARWARNQGLGENPSFWRIRLGNSQASNNNLLGLMSPAAPLVTSPKPRKKVSVMLPMYCSARGGLEKNTTRKYNTL